MKGMKSSFIVFAVVLLLVVPFVSAGLFGDFFDKLSGKMTGEVIYTDGWTQWFDRDSSGGNGDYETLTSLRDAYGSNVCSNIVGIECLTTSGLTLNETGEIVTCTKEYGLVCVNAKQPDGRCNYDYKVRFKCGETTAGGGPTCSDGVKNQDETGIDCGGDACQACAPVVICGNGIQDVGEQCDGTKWAYGASCDDFGYGVGVLGCKTDCTFDFSKCSIPMPVLCGDGICQTTEDCTSCIADCGSCITEDIVCNDTDGGNYYTKGTVYYQNQEFVDGCVQIGGDLSNPIYSGNVVEFGCVNGQLSDTSYNCPNGCFEGRCLEEKEVLNETSVVTGELLEEGHYYWYLGHNFEIQYISINEVKFLIDNEITTEILSEGSVYEFENIKFKVSSILISTKDTVDSGVYLDFEYVNDYTGKCSELIDLMYDVAEGDYSEFGILEREDWWWNDNLYYDEDNTYWVNGNEEVYTRYSIDIEGMNKLDEVEQEFDVDVYVFEDEGINLKDFVNDKRYWDLCQVRDLGINGQDQSAFVCKSLYDIKDQDDENEFTIMWYKDNVFVSISSYEDTYENVDKEEEILSDVFSLMEDLKDNDYEYVDFYVPYSQKKVLETILNTCPSELDAEDYEVEGEEPDWSCALEPAICPPHGQQVERCVDREGIENDRTSTYSCNPGMCSGCMIPKYYSFFGWSSETERRCMPYAARFEMVDSDKNEIYEMEENYSDEYVKFEIFDNYRAYLKVIDEGVTIFDQEVYEGGSYEFNGLYDNEVIKFIVADIFYSSKEDAENYAVFNFIEETDAYCDYDGGVKTQKTRRWDGSWAECQNNFECESNVCSAGECMEIQDMLAEVSGFRTMLVKIMCKASGIFGVQGYDSCLADYAISQE